jgi:hypothetical protein
MHVFVLHTTNPEVAGSWQPPHSTFLASWADPDVGVVFVTLTGDEVTVTAHHGPHGTEASLAYEERERAVLHEIITPALRALLAEPPTLVIVPRWATRAAAEAALIERRGH